MHFSINIPVSVNKGIDFQWIYIKQCMYLLHLFQERISIWPCVSQHIENKAVK